MYGAGARPCFDLLRANPKGFAFSPDDTSDPSGRNFSRALEWRAIMQANSDGGKDMLATEMGWLRDTTVDLGGYKWMKVSAVDQAHYLARAYHKARRERPWMGPLMTWNLDSAAFDPASNH